MQENRRLRDLFADEEKEEKEKLEHDLEYCEQYLRGENPSRESVAAAVEDAGWDEAAARAQMIAHSKAWAAKAAMPPPPPPGPCLLTRKPPAVAGKPQA